MGTPAFAVPSLELLCKHHDVVGVVTALTKPQGRHRQMVDSPVKMFADSRKIKVFQPEKLRDKYFLNDLYSLNADLYVVVAFRMLPKCVWSYPKLGTINLHASLLPDYRGAAPINWAIINGEKTTGLSTFFINEEIDKGNIIMQEEEEILFDDTADTLSERMSIRGAHLLLKTVDLIERNMTVDAVIQNNVETLHEAPKIYTEDCLIDWNRSTMDVYNFIRGLSRNPGAWTIINGDRYKIFGSHPIENFQLQQSEIYSNGKNILYIGTKNGTISIDEIQPEGKRSMNVKEFLAGYAKKIIKP